MNKNMSNEATAVLSYAIYMANMWSQNEAVEVFGKILGEHIFNKWVGYNNTSGPTAASMKLVYELDKENLNRLVNRATSKYCGRKNI